MATLNRPLLTTFLTLISLFYLGGCSSLNRFAVNSSSELLYNVGSELEAEKNFDLVKNGIGGNLLLLEGLLSQSPENLDLIVSLIKGHAGYAFGVNETAMFEEEWSELKSDEGKKQALKSYSRAFEYGLRYLKIKGIDHSELLKNINESQNILHLFDKKLSGSNQRDLEAIIYTAQAYAGLINLQKDNMTLVAEIAVPKVMFDWACSKNPLFGYGTCDIFYGAYEAGRPQMLGGNPAKGKEIFLKAIERHPHNWLIRTSFIQYYAINQNDEEQFKIQMDYLKSAHEKFEASLIYSKTEVEMSWARERKLRFFQALAMKRYELINRFQKQFF